MEAYLEKVVVGLARQLRRRHNVIVHSPELLNGVEGDNLADVIEPSSVQGSVRGDGRLGRLREVLGLGAVVVEGPLGEKRVLTG